MYAEIAYISEILGMATKSLKYTSHYYMLYVCLIMIRCRYIRSQMTEEEKECYRQQKTTARKRCICDSLYENAQPRAILLISVEAKMFSIVIQA